MSLTAVGWIQSGAVLATVLVLHVPVGDYIARTLGPTPAQGARPSARRALGAFGQMETPAAAGSRDAQPAPGRRSLPGARKEPPAAPGVVFEQSGVAAARGSTSRKRASRGHSSCGWTRRLTSTGPTWRTAQPCAPARGSSYRYSRSRGYTAAATHASSIDPAAYGSQLQIDRAFCASAIAAWNAPWLIPMMWVSAWSYW
jgi:hypothetical protein